MGGTASGEGSDNIDWNTDDELEILGYTAPIATHHREATIDNGEASSSRGTSHSELVKHFIGMGFPEKMVLKAIEENGEDTDSILNTLLTYSALEESHEQVIEESPPEPSCFNSELSCSDYDEEFDDFSDMESWCEDNADQASKELDMLLALENMESPSQEQTKLLALAQIGYSIDEASIAIERCPEASVAELVDFLFAARVAREEDFYLQEDERRLKNDLAESSRNKKRKLNEIQKRKKVISDDLIRLPNPMIGFGVPDMPVERVQRSLPDRARRPPFFYYENVALTPKGAWDTISRFLYGIEPEFVDSKYFSATARKRGYVHNLPIENRFAVRPLPPLTIHQALPSTKRWWPSWDKRDKLNCLQTAIGSAKLTERIRDALERYDGEPPLSVQKFVLEQCRKWNLVWVGKNKVAPLEPDEVEKLLGFPRDHTRGGGISRTDRYKSLGNSFQVDTVAYHLSVLKDLYPNGINVLSLFSGIGGAEVALHRLGIKLKNVVSVEISKVNRDILRSWWEQTNQVGNLIDFDDIQLLEKEHLERVIHEVGGFDLVIGGSPCNNLAGSNRVSRDGLEGKDSALFFEYFRVLDLVKRIMDAQN